MIKPIVVIVLTIIALAIFARTLSTLYALLRKGQKGSFSFSVGRALKDLFVMVLGQKKVLSWFYSGLLHAMIFWGFIVLTTTIVEMYGEVFDPHFVFPIIGGTKAMAFCQDLFSMLVMTGVCMALFYRLIIKPKRYEGSDTKDALLILGLITGVVVTLLFMHAGRVLDPAFTYTEGFFVSSLVAHSLPADFIHTAAEVSYWLHLIIVLFFLNWVPRGKHLHLITIIPNILLRKRDIPRGKLRKLDLDDEEAESFGVNSWPEFPMKDLLDTYACMECGRCVAVCPANGTGKELNPKKLHTGIRYAVQSKAKELLAGKEEFPSLIGDIFTEDFFWQCTTCAACVEECPATNEHIDKIIDVRRYMVLTEGIMKPETAQTMKSLENQSNPFAMAHADRFNWAKEMDVPDTEAKADFDYIYWVGCLGCYDQRNKKVTESLIKIMKKADVSFAIMKKEKCTGDPARRVGREDLFQELAEENVENLGKHKDKTIITQCPHCYNTIKNEYPEFGGEFKVIHYAEMIEQLINEGKIKLSKEVKKRIAYHDSCYLGRHNDIYQPPRKALKKVPGATIVEIERCGSKSFCCGAGGGRMFMEETEGKRVNVERVEEAAKKDPEVIASNCPFCLSMFEDGVKVAGLQEKIVPQDIAEIVAEAMDD